MSEAFSLAFLMSRFVSSSISSVLSEISLLNFFPLFGENKSPAIPPNIAPIITPSIKLFVLLFYHP